MLIYDTHCHLNIEPLASEFSMISQQCLLTKVHVNIVGVDLLTSTKAVTLASKNCFFKAIVGVHPCDVDQFDLDWTINQIDKLITANRHLIVAIGETGFDFYHQPFDVALQRKWYQAHHDLAYKHNLKLMCHLRDCYRFFTNFYKESKVRGIIHCYSGTEEEIIDYLNIRSDWLISISGIVTFKNAPRLKQAVALIPLERMVIESDAPWLAPTPFRSKVNYPHYCEYTIRTIAAIKAIDASLCAEILFNNARNFFWN